MASVPWDRANHPTHVVLDLGCTRSIGSRAAIKRFQKHALYYGITTELCRCDKSFVFANAETETCWENCIIHFPTTRPCSTRVGILETGNVPILFSHPQTEHLGMTIELDPKGDKITCPAFGLYSSPAEYSTMGHIVLDLTSLAYQPKSRERSAHLKRHVTFALSEQKSAYAPHTRELDEDDDDKPLVCPDRVTASEDENDEPLVRPSSRREPVKEKRDSAAERSVPVQLRRRKRSSSLARPICPTGTRCVRKLA